MKLLSSLAFLSSVALLGGCASQPSGPRVVVLPGTGKTYNEFVKNDELCCQYAERAIGMTPSGDANRGAPASAPAPQTKRLYGAEAQRRYDETYTQCMYAYGHKVPIPEAVAKTLRQLPAPVPPVPAVPAAASATKPAPAASVSKAAPAAKIPPVTPAKAAPQAKAAPDAKPKPAIPAPPPFAPPESPPPDYAPPR